MDRRDQEQAAVTEDLGGVQGTPPDHEDASAAVQPAAAGSPPDQPPPDAGEIEWAGTVVRKPPHPQT